MIGILGRKVGMTQIFDEGGNVVPVTVVEAGPCHVLQVRTKDRDGYEAVQLGFLDKPRRLAARSERGHVAKLDSKRAKKLAGQEAQASPKADCEPKRFVREILTPGEGEVCKVGETITCKVFERTEPAFDAKGKPKKDSAGNPVFKPIFVDVVGTCKGRGFSGAMRRHNFSGQRATHGVKKCHRAIGGTSASAFPSRTFKGKKMAGQYGNARVTARNLMVVKFDEEKNLLLIRGAVPGPNGGYLLIRKTNKL